MTTVAHLPHDHQARVNAHPHREAYPFVLFQTRIQRLQRVHQAQAGADGPQRIVFVGLGVPEVDEQAVTQELGDMPVKTLNDRCTGGLVRPDDVTEILGVQLA